jgi:hypothetical protein
VADSDAGGTSTAGSAAGGGASESGHIGSSTRGVSGSITVISSNVYSLEFGGLRLGECVFRVRKIDQYASFRASFEKIGLILCSLNAHKGNGFTAAMKTFRRKWC